MGKGSENVPGRVKGSSAVHSSGEEDGYGLGLAGNGSLAILIEACRERRLSVLALYFDVSGAGAMEATPAGGPTA